MSFQNVYKYRTLFFFTMLLLLFFSCVESKKTIAPVVEQTQINEQKLLFINLIFSKTNEGKDSCDLINSITVDGTLREEANLAVSNRENFYTLFLKSCNGEILYKEEMDNQLDSQMEVYKENGAIELKSVSFKEREYSIRMQKKKEKICRLVVEKTVKGKTETICNHLIKL
jgi:hypothetical protein